MITTIIAKKSLNAPDEVRDFPNGHASISSIGDVTVGRVVFEPGWKWSESIKPIAKTESCQASHVIYVISGCMKTVMDDGKEETFCAGDIGVIPPGHD
ncbi:MAG: cupin domain-containing protein, partial [Firmicutes bacterium]|nr:cupin domain-containing protein [Bacillota bacterium]